MQPHTDSLEPRSLVAYDAGFNQPCFYAPDLHSSFESLEYIFRISCYACIYIYIYIYIASSLGTDAEVRDISV